MRTEGRGSNPSGAVLRTVKDAAAAARRTGRSPSSPIGCVSLSAIAGFFPVGSALTNLALHTFGPPPGRSAQSSGLAVRSSGIASWMSRRGSPAPRGCGSQGAFPHPHGSPRSPSSRLGGRTHPDRARCRRRRDGDWRNRNLWGSRDARSWTHRRPAGGRRGGSPGHRGRRPPALTAFDIRELRSSTRPRQSRRARAR